MKQSEILKEEKKKSLYQNGYLMKEKLFQLGSHILLWTIQNLSFILHQRFLNGQQSLACITLRLKIFQVLNDDEKSW